MAAAHDERGPLLPWVPSPLEMETADVGREDPALPAMNRRLRRGVSVVGTAVMAAVLFVALSDGGLAGGLSRSGGDTVRAVVGGVVSSSSSASARDAAWLEAVQDLGADSIEVSNEYTASYGHPGRMYPGLVEGSVVEPHRPTQLQVSMDGVTTAAGVSLASTPSFAWRITQTTNGDARVSAQQEGATVVYTFSSLGTYDAMLTTSVSGLSVAARRTLVCKYVRRDMRKLRDADRERYFDAFKVMIETPSAAGQASFGDSHYRSLEYFVGVHMNLAADRTDDHLHDGMGFLTQHVALTNEFERALQARPRRALCVPSTVLRGAHASSSGRCVARSADRRCQRR